VKLWYDAACEFELNSDFDISGELGKSPSMSLFQIMNVMKHESIGKTSIQAIGDKIILNQLLDNLRVPQMPMLFSTRHEAQSTQVEDLVDSFTRAEENGDAGAFDIVAKPTHLSNGTGALIFSKEHWLKSEFDAEKLRKHMDKYLAERACDEESEALKSLIPGFIVQPRYKSCVDFKAPLEMRVITLWGKARLGIWWWGRQVAGTTLAKGQKPQRTAWLVRKSDADGLNNTEDSWETLHEHKGENKGFEAALELFLKAMPVMAAASESIAKAIGAPFLRSDFFVGSEEWGVRLNEVAYGSGCDVRRKVEGSPAAVDDAPAIARILQEGFKHCKRQPAQHFLGLLGADGATYGSMVVTLDGCSEAGKRPRLPTDALSGFHKSSSRAAMVSPVAASDCETCTARNTCQDLQIGAAEATAPALQVRHALPHFVLKGSVKPRSVCVPVGAPCVNPRLTVKFPSASAGGSLRPFSPPLLLGRAARPSMAPAPNFISGYLQL